MIPANGSETFSIIATTASINLMHIKRTTLSSTAPTALALPEGPDLDTAFVCFRKGETWQSRVIFPAQPPYSGSIVVIRAGLSVSATETRRNPKWRNLRGFLGLRRVLQDEVSVAARNTVPIQATIERAAVALT